jgi:uncharacterized protein (TIGR02145 family)
MATNQSNNATVEKWCYNNEAANCTTYGGLYQWAEAVKYLNGATNGISWNPVPSGNVQGLCPTGWHLPTETELNTLSTNISTLYSAETFKALFEEGTTHWTSNIGTNNSGFTALGSGYVSAGSWKNLKDSFIMWSATESAASSFSSYIISLVSIKNIKKFFEIIVYL